MRSLRGGIAGLTLAVLPLQGCRDSSTGVLKDESGTPVYAPGSPPVERFHFISNADRADVVWSSQDGHGIVSVSKSNGPEAEAFLFYVVFRCDIERTLCQTAEAGFGLIPTADFTGDGGSQLQLRTNTSAEVNPEFFREVGNGGGLEITWKQNPSSLFRITGGSGGVVEIVALDIGLELRTSFSEGGTLENHLAFVQGNALGFPIGEGASGTMSLDNRHTISVQRQ